MEAWAECFVKFNKTTNGRDKIFRTMQYASRFIAWRLAKTDIAGQLLDCPSFAAVHSYTKPVRAKGLETSLGGGRKCMVSCVMLFPLTSVQCSDFFARLISFSLRRTH